MIEFNLDELNGILHVKPNGPLAVEDFLQLTNKLDPYLQKNQYLKGLIIETPKFPGWKNVDAFKAHVNFILGHHAKVKKIALVTDSLFAPIGKYIIGTFIKPEIKHFAYGQTAQAREWVLI